MNKIIPVVFKWIKGFKTLFFVFVFYNYAFAQTFSGITIDQNSKPLASVSVTLHEKNQISIVAFAISDKEGKFSLKYTAQTPDTLQLKAALLGYGSEIITFVNNGNDAEFNFLLKPKAIELKEVKVQNPPVWQRKDTINYNTSEFKQQQDRVIGDIIARLPGMEVKPGGQILYNGKPINKYYIEGLDLLEDKYGIANNNIPADAVDKVQVLENHQPIRLLDSLQLSDRAALNIKLKNNAKMKIVGRAKTGAGFSPLLAEAEAAPMLFKKQFQFINTYKFNNTGLDNSREITAQNFNEYLNAMQNGAVKNDLLELVAPVQPPLSSQRWLFNKAHVAAGNFLVPVSQTYQLRTNISYINDFQTQESKLETKYYLPDDTIAINENNKLKRFVNRLQTDFTLVANRPDYYLKNQLRFQGDWSSEKSQLINVSDILQQLNNPFYNFSNDFSLLKTGKKTVKEWGSYSGYTSLPQKLTVQPGLYANLLNDDLPYDATQQQGTIKNFYTDNFFSFRKMKSKFGSRYKFGFNWQGQQLLSTLYKENAGSKQEVADTFQNNLHWQRARIYINSEWSYENMKWRYSISLPLNYTLINYNDNGWSIAEQKKAVLYRPYISVMCQLNPKWYWSSSLTFGRDFGDINTITPGYLLKNYRNLINNNAPLARVRNFLASSSITFRNPLKIIFLNLGMNYSNSKSNLIYQQVFHGNLQTLLAQLMNNKMEQISFSGRISKYFVDMKTSVAVNSGYSIGNQEQLQQGQLVNIKNSSYTAGFSADSKVSTDFTLRYNCNYSEFVSFSVIKENKTKVFTVNQKIALNFFFSAGIIISASAEHYYTKNSVFSKLNYYFADMNVRLKPKKKRFDFEIGLQNIFNTQNFVATSLANNIEIISELKLRPRQLLARFNFSF